MDYFAIDIDGVQFKKSYLLYVIEIGHSEHGSFYYVGQTGDRNHLIARPAFRRLGAHFSDQGHSTENQVYKSIAEKVLKLQTTKRAPFSPEVKIGVSNFLSDCKIRMHVFPLLAFDDTCLKEEHMLKVYMVEAVEKKVINELVLRQDEHRVLNKKRLPSIAPLPEEMESKFKEIMNKVCPEVNV